MHALSRRGEAGFDESDPGADPSNACRAVGAGGRFVGHSLSPEEHVAIGQTSAQMALRDPDIRLMLRVRDDDSTAFAELVERFQHRLVAVMHHLIGSADEAEDLAQEVFLRVYRTRKKYTPKAKFSTWLFTIANNLALN